MFAMGMGRGNPKMRFIRLGLVALIILAGVVFHHTGKAYETIRVLYYIAILGFLLTAVSQKRRMSQGGQGGPRMDPWRRPPNGPNNAGPSAPFGQQPVQAPIETRLVEKETPNESQD